MTISWLQGHEQYKPEGTGLHAITMTDCCREVSSQTTEAIVSVCCGSLWKENLLFYHEFCFFLVINQ